MKAFIIILAASALAVSQVQALVIQNTPESYILEFENNPSGPVTIDQQPVGAPAGESIRIHTDGESLSIAISIVFEDGSGNLTDSLFVFEGIQGVLDDDILVTGQIPGTVLVFTEADFSPGDGLFPGYGSTRLELTVGSTGDLPFTDARLTLSNEVPDTGQSLGLFAFGLAALGFYRRTALK